MAAGRLEVERCWQARPERAVSESQRRLACQLLRRAGFSGESCAGAARWRWLPSVACVLECVALGGGTGWDAGLRGLGPRPHRGGSGAALQPPRRSEAYLASAQAEAVRAPGPDPHGPASNSMKLPRR